MKDRTLQWFEASALAPQDRPALEVGDEVVSYGELRSRAIALAGRIVAAHGGQPDRVALVASRSVAAYVAYLAIQRLGTCVVPLNPDFGTLTCVFVGRLGVEPRTQGLKVLCSAS